MIHDTPISRTLILFDVDGVLIHPAGYKAATRATVEHFAAAMGQSYTGPSDDEIAVFEANGITNEWDSCAICTADTLLAALDRQPDLLRPSLEATFAAIREAGLALPRPDYAALARDVVRGGTDGRLPAADYLAHLRTRVPSERWPVLEALLGHVYDLGRAPVTRVFQSHALGSARYAATYGLPPMVEAESCLTAHDRPLLDHASRERLLVWLGNPAHGAVIFTARPSLPPADVPPGALPGTPPAGYSPDAELAAELLDLAGHLPLIGQGRIGWLAWRENRPVEDYVKPAPVQALAAIAAAAARAEFPALDAAAVLYESGRLIGPLAALATQSTRVVVFEDSPTGIRAARGATEVLRRAGLNVTFECVGVSPNPDKRAALSAIAGQVVDDINAGLELIWSG